MEYINNAIGQAKMDFNDPLIVIGGDMNKHDLGEATLPYPDTYNNMPYSPNTR